MSAKRVYTDYLSDILIAATHAQSFVAGLNFDAFQADPEKVYAVTRALEIIGEAARQLPESLLARHPELPWHEMIGMRNVVIHEYFGVEYEVLWRTVHEDLPPLRVAVKAILEAER
jgi:uncharacterized protein with HEPN domain